MPKSECNDVHSDSQRCSPSRASRSVPDEPAEDDLLPDSRDPNTDHSPDQLDPLMLYDGGNDQRACRQQHCGQSLPLRRGKVAKRSSRQHKYRENHCEVEQDLCASQDPCGVNAWEQQENAQNRDNSDPHEEHARINEESIPHDPIMQLPWLKNDRADSQET